MEEEEVSGIGEELDGIEEEEEELDGMEAEEVDGIEEEVHVDGMEQEEGGDMEAEGGQYDDYDVDTPADSSAAVNEVI